MDFWGFRRKNGAVGIRNHVLVMPTVVCANQVARGIAANLKGVVWFEHQHGCGQLGADAEITKKVLVGHGSHPNVYGVIVLGLGCETVRAQDIANAIRRTDPDKPVECLIIQEEGGSALTIAKGANVAVEMVKKASAISRQAIDVNELIIGTECGGSDSCSGISANPAVGAASDLLVNRGGTVILAETTELIGAEHLLAQRAVNQIVANLCYQVVAGCEDETKKMGVDIRGSNPSPGNLEGGLSTIEEKSLGCIYKAGSSPLVDVIGYGEAIKRKGLLLMDTPGHDIEQITAMVAGGCHLVVFTTGRGTVTGSPIVPVIKISSNTAMFEKMKFNMDLDAGAIIAGNESILEVGQRLFNEELAVASGKLTITEIIGSNEFAIKRIGPTT